MTVDEYLQKCPHNIKKKVSLIERDAFLVYYIRMHYLRGKTKTRSEKWVKALLYDEA